MVKNVKIEENCRFNYKPSEAIQLNGKIRKKNARDEKRNLRTIDTQLRNMVFTDYSTSRLGQIRPPYMAYLSKYSSHQPAQQSKTNKELRLCKIHEQNAGRLNPKMDICFKDKAIFFRINHLESLTEDMMQSSRKHILLHASDLHLVEGEKCQATQHNGNKKLKANIDENKLSKNRGGIVSQTD